MTLDLDPSLNLYVKAALGRKALELVADTFIICSGSSNRQVTAIADHIKDDLKKHGIRPLSIEGMKEGHWVLLDYGHIVMHVFHEPIRDFYDLEGLWVDAKRISF
jgi:ribosome-associated protein